MIQCYKLISGLYGTLFCFVLSC